MLYPPPTLERALKRLDTGLKSCNNFDVPLVTLAVGSLFVSDGVPHPCLAEQARRLVGTGEGGDAQGAGLVGGGLRGKGRVCKEEGLVALSGVTD